MPSSAAVTALAKFYIGTTAEVNFSTTQIDTWVQVKDLHDLSELGDSAEAVKFQTIDSGRTHVLKGVRDAGDFELVVVRNVLDQGQINLKLAEGSSATYNFKMVLNDKPNPTGNSSEFYFRGIVLSAKNEFGDGNAVVKTKFVIAIASPVYDLPATVGA